MNRTPIGPDVWGHVDALHAFACGDDFDVGVWSDGLGVLNFDLCDMEAAREAELDSPKLRLLCPSGTESPLTWLRRSYRCVQTALEALYSNAGLAPPRVQDVEKAIEWAAANAPKEGKP